MLAFVFNNPDLFYEVLEKKAFTFDFNEDHLILTRLAYPYTYVILYLYVHILQMSGTEERRHLISIIYIL